MSASSASAIRTRRSAFERSRGTSTSPHCSRRGGSASSARRANPIPVVPGSIPRTVPALRVLKHLERYVEVRVDLLHVVEVLEALHQLQHLLGLLAVDADAVRRAHAHLG